MISILEPQKITEDSKDLLKKLITVYTKTSSKTKDEINHKIGQTDYAKFEKIANEIEKSDILSKTQILNAANPNDFKLQKQAYEGVTKPKLEASQIFKNEGDFHLKMKKFNLAINSYEKALLQLFYNVTDEEEDQKKVEKMKMSLNLNLSVAFMNLKKYKEAIGNLLEAKRLDKKNLKTIYRIAFCYLQINDLENSKKFIEEGLSINSQSVEFIQLKKEIVNKEKENDSLSGKMFKRAMKSK